MSAYRFSSDANRDIADICDYIFEINPPAALHFLDQVERTCDLIASHPLIGRARPELGQDIRSFPIGSYLIFYLPAKDGVDVARVIYGGRDLPSMF